MNTHTICAIVFGIPLQSSGDYVIPIGIDALAFYCLEQDFLF